MRLGISSYTYSWAIGVPGNMPERPMSYDQLLDKAIEMDVGCVQIADNLPLHKLHEEGRHQLMAKAEKHNISIEVGMRGLTPSNIERYLDLANYFRSPILRAVIDRDEYKPDVPTVIRTINEYLPEFKSRNISLAIENHDRFQSGDFAKIIETVGDAHAGICLDSVNSMGAGEGMAEVMQWLGPYTINFHIKDFTVKRASHMMGFVVEGTPAGKGMLPLTGILGKLNKWGQCESGILELWTPPRKNIRDTIDLEESWARESIQNLKLLFNPSH